MRKIIVAGNWKMNTLWKEAESLFTTVQDGANLTDKLHKIFVFPPALYLPLLERLNTKDFVQIGAQNVAAQNAGAYTGEISASMLKSIGINVTLIGHSERRSVYAESNELLKDKVNRSIENGLNIVFCCGESLDERKSNKQESVIEEQLAASLFHLSESEMKHVTIAYEPVWAIGTGETATSLQAEEMHSFIRALIKKKYSEKAASSTYILYGGSCNSGNAKELFACENVDGGLIGGASLKAEEFLKIISIVNE